MFNTLNTLSHKASASVSAAMFVRTKSAAKLRAGAVFALVALTLTSLSTSDAFANSNLNTYVQNVSGKTNSVVDIVTYFSYIGGAALSALGIIDLKKHVENPGNNPLKNGLAKLGFGGMLLAFPSISSIVVGTVSDGSGQVQYKDFTTTPPVIN
jgi:hypothetical protein